MASPITWRNVNTPSFAGTVAAGRVGSDLLSKSIENFTGAAKDFGQTITDDRTGRAVSALAGLNDRETYADEAAALRAGLGPNVDMTKFAEAQTARGTLLDDRFSNELINEKNQLGVNLAQSELDYLPTERKLAEEKQAADIKRMAAANLASNASVASSQATTNLSEYTLGEKERIRDTGIKDTADAQALLTARQQLGNEVMDQDDVDSQINELALKLGASQQAMADYNIGVNDWTKATDAEAAEIKLLAADKLAEAKKEESRLDREGRKDVAKINAFGKNKSSKGAAVASAALQNITKGEDGEVSLSPFSGWDFDQDSRIQEETFVAPYAKSLGTDVYDLINKHKRKGIFGGVYLDRANFTKEAAELVLQKNNYK